MKKNLANLLAIAIALIPSVYLIAIWNRIPETVALHFNGKFEADKMGDKEQLWIPVGVLGLVSLLVYFLMSNISRIDPKQKGFKPSSTFNKLAAGIVIFISALSCLIINSAYTGANVMQKLFYPLLGLLFIFLGNYMNNIRPNYFAGFRLPWTLSDDDNWRKTHHLAGKLWFGGGILVVLLSLFLSFEFMRPVFIAIVVMMAIIPAVYSYRLFKAKQAM